MDIRNPRSLLAPAQKLLDPNSWFPDTLDHYKCYHIVDVHEAPETPLLSLYDQFGSQHEVTLGPPVFFCPPAKKEREGYTEEAIKNPKNHLTFYDIPMQDNARDFTFNDQFFSEKGLVTTQSILLGVPSLKDGFETHDN